MKILHLEDLPEDAELVQREIRKANIVCEIKTVDNKESYEEALTHFKPDIIISDHSLPFFNSFEALNLLQSSPLDVPFILVTSTVSEDFAVGIIKKGATDYILKDRLQRLPSALTKALENKRLETEHQHFLQEVIANETLMNDAQALANFGSFSINLISGVITMSREAFFIFGFAQGECLPGFEISITEPSAQLQNLRLKVADIYLDLQPGKKDYRLIDNLSRLKFISAELRLEKNDIGKIIGIKGFLYNTTRLKSAELMLQQSEANLKTIFETTDTGYILFSRDQRIISFNRKASFFVETQTGRRLQDGELLTKYIAIARQEFVEQAFNNALAGQSVTYENHIVNNIGEGRWYFSRWFPVTGHANSNHGVIIVMSDITERKQAEIEREKIAADLIIRNNALERFSYIVSHNLRAPVANIMGISGILRNADKTKQIDTTQFLDALDTSITKLDGVVQDLNQILRISKHLNEEKQVVYFQQLIDEVKKQLNDTIEKTEATITSNFTAIMHTLAVKSFLHHIFFNLLHNSLIYKKDDAKPHISITSKLNESKIILQFIDNGKGIDMTKFGNKIFGLYQRFDTSVAGKGVGLCMVKTLVENMGGCIDIASSVGYGTKVTIELPVSA